MLGDISLELLLSSNLLCQREICSHVQQENRTMPNCELLAAGE